MGTSWSKSKLVRFHLNEAQQAIAALIAKLDSDRQILDEWLLADFILIYQHVNSGWNSRTHEDWDDYTKSENGFYELVQFPEDLKEWLVRYEGGAEETNV